MKRIIITALVFVLMAVLAVPMDSSADYAEDEEINAQVDELLADYDIDWKMGDISGLDFSDILNEVRSAAAAKAGAPLKILGTLIAVVVFTSVIRNFGESTLSAQSSQLYDMICVITAVAVIAPQLMTVYGNAMTAVERIGGFITVFVPVFTAIKIAGGGIASGGFYNFAILGASEAVIVLSRAYLMPILSLTAVLAITGSTFPSASVESMVGLIKKVTTWGMTVVMTLFTGFVSLKCTLTSKADGAATKTAKFVMSGFIPIVGGAVSDAYTTVRSSFEVVGGTVGAAGTFAVLLMMLPPVVEIVIFRFVMWIGAAVAEMFSSAALTKLLKGIDSGLAIAQSLLICYGLMFILCTAILMQAS